MPLMLDYDPGRIDISTKIRNQYFPNSYENPVTNMENLTLLYSDRVYFHAAKKAATLHSHYAPVFFYYFSYKSEMSFFSLFKAVLPAPSDFFPPEIKIAADVTKDLFWKYVVGSSTPKYGSVCYVYLKNCFKNPLLNCGSISI